MASWKGLKSSLFNNPPQPRMFRYPTPRLHPAKLTIYQPTTLDVLQAFKARSGLLSSLGLGKITTPRPLS